MACTVQLAVHDDETTATREDEAEAGGRGEKHGKGVAPKGGITANESIKTTYQAIAYHK